MSDRPVYLETWECRGSLMHFVLPNPADGAESCDVEYIPEMYPHRAQLAAAAPALVRALLACEWEGIDGQDLDASCPQCHAWVCTGRKHDAACELWFDE